MFNINFIELTTSILPWMLLKPKLKAWVDSLLKPLADLYSNFLEFRREKLFDATITGQIMYLEYMLNLEFYQNGLISDIYIADDTNANNDLFLFNRAENERKTFIYNRSEGGHTYIYNASEIGVYDFVVMVPASLSFDYDFMFSLVTKYKIAGPTFTIRTY